MIVAQYFFSSKSASCQEALFEENNSERPVDALALKKVNHWLSDNLKSRDASASKNIVQFGEFRYWLKESFMKVKKMWAFYLKEPS